MAYNIFLFTVGILFGLHADVINGAKYGDYCSLFSYCDYEGGWCDPFANKCSCEEDDVVFSLRTGMCQKEKALGSHCYHDNNCTSPNSRCWTDEKCRCQDGFYDTNEKIFPGGECKPEAKLGETCSSIEACRIDHYTYADCNAGVCTCHFRYYPSNGSCVYDKNLHETGCNIDGFDSCMFSTQCIDDTCKCKPGYKQLMPVYILCGAERDWVPIGPYVFDVGTNGFSVGWSRPVASYKVKCYFVELRGRNLPNQTGNKKNKRKTVHVVYPASNYIQAEHTKHEFRSLTPGEEYSVGVMMSVSEEACKRKRLPKPTLTDPHKDKRDFSEMIYAKQRTIPSKPEPIQLDKCDIVDRDGYIRLHLNPPEGKHDGFRVIITSGSNWITGVSTTILYLVKMASALRLILIVVYFVQ